MGRVAVVEEGGIAGLIDYDRMRLRPPTGLLFIPHLIYEHGEP
jgi:hypothetical protein